LSMSSSICLPRGRLLSSIRGRLARAIPKFAVVCPTVTVRLSPSLSVWPRAGLRGPACSPGCRLHYPRHRRVPLTRSLRLHTRSESSGPGATGSPATLAARAARSRHSSSSQVSPRVHHHDPPAAHPSRPSVRPSDSPVCHESAPGSRPGPGLPARAVRSCYPTRRVGVRSV
jgi:hypothetical protein